MPNTQKLNAFAQLNLIPPLLQSLAESGYKEPTPIQKLAIPPVLNGNDLLGIAQTGTGKTAAFSLPILQLLDAQRKPYISGSPRVLILTPTRELAIQIHQSLQTYGKHLRLTHQVVFGGVGYGNQLAVLKRGLDVLVATPGRLLDFLNQKVIKLDKVEIFVLDEADRMLDMGFYPDLRKILPHLPKKRHNLFFSATMPEETQKLASSILHNPKMVEITPQATTAEKVTQYAMYVDRDKKIDLLLHTLQDEKLNKVLVFCGMKHLANKIAEKLSDSKIASAAIHSNKSQGARQKALEEFHRNKLRVLVATDIMARGIDVDGITHVINFDVPHVVEDYVHRIGRTARAGQEGVAISFCSKEEKSFIFGIEKVTRQKIDVIVDQPFHSEEVNRAQVMSPGKAKAILESQREERKRTANKNFNPGRKSFGHRKPKSSGNSSKFKRR